MKNEMILRMDRLQKVTEEIYVDLGIQCSVLNSNIKESIKKKDKILLDFHQQLTANDGESIRSNVDTIEKYITYVQEKVTNQNGSSREMLSNMLSGFNSVKQLKGKIANIKDSSELMEVLALNSMVVAVKAGNSGGGFSYITEVLRKTAEKTINLSDKVSLVGSDVQKKFHEIESLIEIIEKSRAVLQKKLINIQNVKIGQMKESLDIFMQSLQHINQEEDLVRDKVSTIIEEIQKQDIIRQSIDHIILYLKKIPDAHAKVIDTSTLNYLTINEYACSFAVSVLLEVKECLEGSLNIFEDSIKVSIEKSENVNKLIDQLSDSSDTESSSHYLSLMNNLVRDYASLLGDIDLITSEEGKLVNLNVDFFTKIENLQTEMSKFNSLITLYGNINLLAKIEIAKQDSLKDIKSSLDEMGEITAFIERNLEEIIETNSKFISEFSGIRNEMANDISQVNDMKTLCQTSLDKIQLSLKSSSVMINDNMSDYRIVGKELLEKTTEMQNSTDGLRTNINEVNDVIQFLEDQSLETSKEKEEIMGKIGLKSWKIEDKESLALMNQFTIYKHRSMAGEISGITLKEEEANQGSVTLF